MLKFLCDTIKTKLIIKVPKLAEKLSATTDN